MLYREITTDSVWRMRCERWIIKSTDVHSEHVIFTFPLQQWLHERTSLLSYTHIACHVHARYTESLPIKLPVYGILNYEYTTMNANIDIMIPTIESLFNSPYSLKRLKKIQESYIHFSQNMLTFTL